MGNCVNPEHEAGHEELFPAQLDPTADDAKPALMEAIRGEADMADEDVETAAGSDVSTCERLSRSLSSESCSPLSPQSSPTDLVDFTGKWVCSRVEGASWQKWSPIKVPT